MKQYLEATGRREVAQAADHVQMQHGFLQADAGAENFYDRVIELDLSKVEPHLSTQFGVNRVLIF
jgi:aconitase A